MLLKKEKENIAGEGEMSRQNTEEFLHSDKPCMIL